MQEFCRSLDALKRQISSKSIFRYSVVIFSFVFFLCCIGENAIAKTSSDELIEVLLKINVELENIEKIPPNFSEEVSEDGVVTGKIDFDNRAQYIANNKGRYFNLISEISSLVENKKFTVWYDDLLFLRAYFMCIIANLNKSQESLDHAIQYVEEYLNLGEMCEIEERTKEIFRSSVWKNLEPYYSSLGTEKNKLNQFFYLCQASLFEQTDSLSEKAIISYENVLKIDSNNIWGQQAMMRIKALESLARRSNTHN